jgi:hypothetical protein
MPLLRRRSRIAKLNLLRTSARNQQETNQHSAPKQSC